jgi:signal transduction histidine kinase
MSSDLARATRTAPAGGVAPAGITRRTRRAWAGLEILAFVVVPLLVLVAVAATTVLVSERIARANARAEAESVATRFTEIVLTPLLGGALAHEPGKWAVLEEIVTNRLSDGSITFLVVWSLDGEILFASVDEAVGRHYPPTPEMLVAADGTVVSDVDESPESSYRGRVAGPMVEVYVPTTANGETVVVEAYFSYNGIEEQAALLRGELIPVAVGALVVLELVQLPIATALARRVRRQETERAELMRRSLTASERERRSIAADVHDGPVQDLAGASYALGALRNSLPEERRADADRLIAAVRRAVRSLRRLMVDLYPPDLSGAGLPDAIEDLVTPLRAEGIDVTVHAAPVPELSRDNAAVVYRTAKEALVNAAKHASATHVWVHLGPVDDGPRHSVRLDVTDNGVGFPATGTDRHSEGHLGLRLVEDRVRDVGGTLELRDRPGGGASMTVVVPAGRSA